MKIGLISDLHANAPAVRSVISDLISKEPDEIFCAGDIVGYYPFPDETIDIIDSKRIYSVKGNHDEALLTGDTTGFSIHAARAIDWTRRNISERSISLLSELPTSLRRDVDGVDLSMVHGSPRIPLNEYISPNDVTDRRIKSWFDEVPDVLVLGHTHKPFKKRVDGVLVINPGSVGQPRDDDPRSAYAIIDTESGRVNFFRTSYDIEQTAEKTKEYLPIQLSQRLYSGK